jgi:hypothetical protein
MGCAHRLGLGNSRKNSAMRMNLAHRLDAAAALDFVSELDAWALECVAKNAERLLKGQMTHEQVAAGHHPCVRHEDG